jgi:hypothetical protein
LGADATLYAAAIGSVLFLVLSVPVIVLCQRALREHVGFEGEIKTPWFSYRLRTDAPKSGDGDSRRASRAADAGDPSLLESQHDPTPTLGTGNDVESSRLDAE